MDRRNPDPCRCYRADAFVNEGMLTMITLWTEDVLIIVVCQNAGLYKRLDRYRPGAA